MSEKISRKIFIGELIIIVLPSSLLLSLATIIQNSLTFDLFPLSTLWGSYHLANSIFALVACFSLSSGIVISKKFLDEGSKGLDAVKKRWWIFSLPGGILAISSAVVSSLPPPPEYSAMETFRNTFDLFRLGIPMFIPFTHLILEKYLRKN